MDLVVHRAASLQGQLRPASDKSLTHRAYMLAAIAEGESLVRTPLVSQDCEETLQCLRKMGLEYDRTSSDEIRLRPARDWKAPEDDLYCGNSGTTIRLMSGLIASRSITAVMSGDESLSRRPMRRIADPLRLMGAEIEGDTPPLVIKGKSGLRAIDYSSPVASGQIKSCILLAGLRAQGKTVVREPSLSRDHTERMLSALGVDVHSLSGDEESVATLNPGNPIKGFEFRVPADISSASFFIVAACIVPSSHLLIFDLGTNPTRSGVFDVLEQVGAPYSLENQRQELNEPVADLEIRAPRFLQPFEIGGALVPRLIDEIPVLSVLATQCDGVTTIRDASELRVKESDRIELIAHNLRAMGADVKVLPDGLEIGGPTKLKGTYIETAGDHRIAMAFAVAGLIADGQTTVKDVQNIATSYPDFEAHLGSVCVA